MVAFTSMFEEGVDCFPKPKGVHDKAACALSHRQFEGHLSENWKLVRDFLAFKTHAEGYSDTPRGFRWCRNNFLAFNKLKAALKLFEQFKLSVVKFN